MNDISDTTVLLRRYRWELYINNFVDIMQITFQLILFTTSANYLWVFLIPHVVSISMVFGFFSASDDSARSQSAVKTTIASQVFESITLLTDSILTLVIIYAIVECAALGNTTFKTPLLFGSNLCQGSRFNGGILEAIELVFSAGSVYLQTNQLATLEKVFRIQAPQHKGGMTLVVISIALSMYTVSYLGYRTKYALLAMDIVALTASAFAMFLQYALPTTRLSKNERVLRVLDIILYSIGWIINLGMVIFVIADKVSLCNEKDTENNVTCSFTDTVSVVLFALVVFVRVVTQLVYRFVTTQNQPSTTKLGWKKR